MPPRPITLGGLIPVGFQVMSLANTTAVAVNSTCRASNILDISVESVDARFRADGTAPANATGVVLTAGNTYRWEGYNGTANLKFVRKGTTGTCTVSLFAWKHKTPR